MTNQLMENTIMTIQEEFNRITLSNLRFAEHVSQYKMDEKARIYLYGWIGKLKYDFENLQTKIGGEK